MHPETTADDIVKDLAESNIIIGEKDVVKKSKEGSALLSFKVSVRAEDLQLALNPQIWPLRVKVREYIYYPKKKSPDTSSNQVNAQNNQQLNPSIILHPPGTSGNSELGAYFTNRFSALEDLPSN